jgi:hypothetical protein
MDHFDSMVRSFIREVQWIDSKDEENWTSHDSNYLTRLAHQLKCPSSPQALLQKLIILRVVGHE